MSIDLDTLHLAKGSHQRRGTDSVCLMEAVAWFAGEPHSDAPQCASPLLRSAGISLNDTARTQEEGDELLPFIPLVVGTAGDGHDGERSAMAWEWLVHTYTPTWLELAGLTDAARALRLVDTTDGAATLAELRSARDAARDAARAAARAALKPTVDALRPSAIDLYRRMCLVGREAA